MNATRYKRDFASQSFAFARDAWDGAAEWREDCVSQRETVVCRQWLYQSGRAAVQCWARRRAGQAVHALHMAASSRRMRLHALRRAPRLRRSLIQWRWTAKAVPAHGVRFVKLTAAS